MKFGVGAAYLGIVGFYRCLVDKIEIVDAEMPCSI